MLLLVALLLGVVAMHATVAPGVAGHGLTDHSMGMSTTPGIADATSAPLMIETGAGAAVATPAEMTGAVPLSMPTPALHELLHLCLAVLVAMMILIGLMLVAFQELARGVPGRTRVPAVVIVRLRSPPRTAVRLAQLCVLRN